MHMGSFRHKTRVHSGTFRYIQDFSMTSPLTGDLGNREKYKYTWVHSVQPPQPYIILRGEWETEREERCTTERLRSAVGQGLALEIY